MDMEKERPQEVSLRHDSDLSATIPPLQRKSSLVPWKTILEMRQVAANKRKQEEIRSKIHNNWLVRETQKMWFRSLAHLIFGITNLNQAETIPSMNQAHGFRIHSESGGMAVALRPVRIKIAIKNSKRSRLCGNVSHGNREVGRSSPL